MLKGISLILLLTSCTSPPLMAPGKLYKKEIDMTINEHKAKGVHSERKSPAYNLLFEFDNTPDVVKLTTCHRELTFRDVGKKLKFTYNPVKGLEDTGFCPLELGAFDSNGAHSWALVDFQDDESIPVTVNCNGDVNIVSGVSSCQSRAGLTEVLYFTDPVRSRESQGCNPAISTNLKHYKIEVSRDKCVYLFTGARGTHRHLSFGYDDVYIKPH